ncbi:hypothetical protein CCUS01_05699 [Colletotrichum cuscutae]|uniref:Uncharacterized protein n=1 Tax=Colletotrichum cuscutae TaxID=1209917 RepID=A0AAI9Y5L1_9PEZI|nr:hypothetical protein CCUS01_05699 [Colletotrichum cuscutae]
MDSLPQEILDNTLGRIPARESDNYNEELLELENWMDVDSEAFDPETPRLRLDLAAVCRKFQLGIERAIFRSLASLRELHVNIVTPEYRHSSGPSDIVENMAHCDIAHTEILRELMLMLSEWPDDTRVSLSIGLNDKHYRKSETTELHHFNVFPTSARHGKLIILPNEYGPFQQLPQMTKDGESDPLFLGLRRAIDGFSEFEYGGHLSSSFFWSPPPSLGDAVPYWQNMTKLKDDCDMVLPSGEWYLKHHNTRIVEFLSSTGRIVPGAIREGDAEEPVWKADVSELVKRRNIERSYLEDNPPDRQYSVSGDDKVAAWTVNEKVMMPMLTSIAKAAGQMISLKELRFKVILAKYDRYQGSEWFHRFHVGYLAPGVMPDVDDERFPRCKCYSKDWIPEFRARQAGDLEKALLLLRIKN